MSTSRQHANDHHLAKVTGATVTLVGGGLALVVPTADAATFSANSLASLQQAITDANVTPGVDTITVAAGTITLTDALPAITESVVINGAGQGVSIIDAASNYRIFYLSSSAAQVTMSGLTLANGFTDGDGGAISAIDSALTLSNVTFDGNDALAGGAIRWDASDATLTITDSVFTGNGASYYGGGAIAARSGDNATVVITGSTFTGNSAIYNYGGGALLVNPNTSLANVLTVSDTTFDANSTSWGTEGGAVFVKGDYLDATFDNVTFSGNYAYSDGGAFLAYEVSSVTISNSTFVDNRTPSDGGAIYAAIVFDGVTITDTVFDGNYSGYFGGAIAQSTEMRISNCTFVDNYADSKGGAIYVEGDRNGGSGALTVSNSTFVDNIAGWQGGAISISLYFDRYDVSHTIEQSTFTGNRAGGDDDGDGYGGAIYTGYTTDLTITNSTIAGNSAAHSGGVHGSGESLTIVNTIIADNTDDSGDSDLGNDEGTLTVDHSLVEATTLTLNGTGNLTGVDPLLSPLADNGGVTETMLLQANSPAIDAGDTAVQPFATDQRGEARVYQSIIDMGAVEATAEERGSAPVVPELPETGDAPERSLWVAALLSGAGAVLSLGASRRRARG